MADADRAQGADDEVEKPAADVAEQEAQVGQGHAAQREHAQQAAQLRRGLNRQRPQKRLAARVARPDQEQDERQPFGELVEGDGEQDRQVGTACDLVADHDGDAVHRAVDAQGDHQQHGGLAQALHGRLIKRADGAGGAEMVDVLPDRPEQGVAARRCQQEDGPGQQALGVGEDVADGDGQQDAHRRVHQQVQAALRQLFECRADRAPAEGDQRRQCCPQQNKGHGLRRQHG